MRKGLSYKYLLRGMNLMHGYKGGRLWSHLWLGRLLVLLKGFSRPAVRK